MAVGLSRAMKSLFGKKLFIIAEAGVNHNSRLDLALKLVDAAAAAGADAVKFQTFKADHLVTKAGRMAAYQKRNTGKKESQIAMLRKLELNEKFYAPIIKRCRERKIEFISTPHGGFESVDLLARLNVKALKFGSADLTNLPVLAYAARLKKIMIISTGMATMQEIKDAVRIIRKTGNKKIVVLQCTTDYPTKPDEVNVRAMQSIAKACSVEVGFSDHSKTEHAAIIAVTLGASVIEKHLTLDKTLEGPDHAASSEPNEFKEYVQALRSVETLLGSPIKKPSKSEEQYIPLVRKSVVTLKAIKKGDVFTKMNIGIKRPGTGIPPSFYSTLLGKHSKRDIRVDELLTRRDLLI